MTIGLSTYAFFWQWHDTAISPLSLTDMIEKTAEWDVKLFQICDYPAIDSYDDAALTKLRRHAESCAVTLEVGTRGVTPSHLSHYLHIAKLLGARLVRSMINTADHRPTPEQAVRMLGQSTPAYEQAGVTLALETYEQVPVRDLVGIVDAVDSPNLGICLDPANCVAALELPRDTIELTAPRVANVHVKDFAFTRQAGWVGFSLVGGAAWRRAARLRPPDPDRATRPAGDQPGGRALAALARGQPHHCQHRRPVDPPQS